MAKSLQDALVIVLSEGQVHGENEDYTVEVIMDDLSGPSHDLFRNHQPLTKFLNENPDASATKHVLDQLMTRFLSSNNPNDYFSEYCSVLCRSEDWGIPPGRALEILQLFFPVIENATLRFPVADEARGQDSALNSEDRRIIGYISGYIIRSLYYSRSTTEGEKNVLLNIKCKLHEGTIASERNRPSSETEERLWGVQSAVLHLLEAAEISFRHHAAVKPMLDIRPDFYTSFICQNHAPVSQIIGNLTCKSSKEANMGIIIKILMKYIEIRCHSYARKHGRKLSKKKVAKVHGLRAGLKKCSKSST